MAKIASFGWERRIRATRPQSYDIAIAIALAVAAGMAASYPSFW
jgi:hypothetical protein